MPHGKLFLLITQNARNQASFSFLSGLCWAHGPRGPCPLGAAYANNENTWCWTYVNCGIAHILLQNGVAPDAFLICQLFRFKCRCQIVEKADYLFKVYIANAYMTEVPIVVLLMYNLLSTQQDTMHRVTGMVFFLQILAEMVLISAACIIVNSQVGFMFINLF